MKSNRIYQLTGAFILIFFSIAGSANELGSIKKATQSQEYDALREKYLQCVTSRGLDYMRVNSIDSAIAHAPIACKRELLSIRQFLLAGAFKVDVIDQLVMSVEQGAEIDLVNAVYNQVLTEKGIKR